MLPLRRLPESQVVMMEDEIEATEKAEKEKKSIESLYLTANACRSHGQGIDLGISTVS
jgi:hypothetical protein